MSSEKQSYHSRPVQEVLQELDVNPDHGLAENEVVQRREQYGPNRLRRAERRSVWSILLDQVKSVVLLILAVAAIIAFATGSMPEGIALVAVVVVNGLIGFVSEWRATRSMEALRSLGRQVARVRREGSEREIPASELVPGDIVLASGEDVVPADLRLVEASGLRVNEAVLTGESVPANKRANPVEEDAPLAERSCMLYKGTGVSEGSAVAVVVHTGMDTELGRIADLAGGVEEEETPLEQNLDRLGRRLAYVALGAAAVIALVGLLLGRPPIIMLETAIALGVAAVPEGLPIVATIALARGMWLMAKRQAVVNRLKAVETLGATGIIMTDKTGTLTENRMTVSRTLSPAGDYEIPLRPGQTELLDPSDVPDDPLVRRMIELGVLCSNASLGEIREAGDETGDPTEVALLEAGLGMGMPREKLLEQKPEVREVSFDPDVMMMATFHQADDALEVAVKGAPDPVIGACSTVATAQETAESLSDEKREQWQERARELAEQGYRLLALADRTAASKDEEPYQDLRLVGLVAMFDPPREGVKTSIDACQSAGVRVCMITGDRADTAFAIGRKTGVIDDPDAGVISGPELKGLTDLSSEERTRVLNTQVFARVSPEQKLNLVSLFMDSGQTVAVTGDGVNDAPALKKADIGIAMGKRGTDAARQVSDMVLKDDAFSSIVAAVQQGRNIFGNIRKSVMFMLCTNLAEVIAVGLAAFAHAPLPLRPLQILFLNVLTDVFPALALGVNKGSARVMDRPPRDPDESVLTSDHWRAISGWSVLMAGCVLAALVLASLLGVGGGGGVPIPATGLEPETQFSIVTISFLTLAFGKLWFVLNLRDPGTTFLDNDIVRNGWVWAAMALCVVLLFMAIYLPGLSHVLKTRPPSATGWAIILVLSALPVVTGQIIRAVQRSDLLPSG